MITTVTAKNGAKVIGRTKAIRLDAESIYSKKFGIASINSSGAGGTLNCEITKDSSLYIIFKSPSIAELLFHSERYQQLY